MDSGSLAELPGRPRHDHSVAIFRWSEELIETWDRDALVSKVLGKRLVQVTINPDLIFLDFDIHPDFTIGVTTIQDAHSNELLLRWTDTY